MHVNYQQAIDKNLLLDFKICYHGLLSMVSIALVDARKTSLTGVQNSKKKSARRYAARTSPLRGSWTMLRIDRRWLKPPLGKKLDPPLNGVKKEK